MNIHLSENERLQLIIALRYAISEWRRYKEPAGAYGNDFIQSVLGMRSHRIAVWENILERVDPHTIQQTEGTP
jgi:hypothetical protein